MRRNRGWWLSVGVGTPARIGQNVSTRARHRTIFEHDVRPTVSFRCRNVYAPKYNRKFFPPSPGSGNSFLGKARFPFQMTARILHRAAGLRIIWPREWMKIAKNSRKRTCRRGSARWTPREGNREERQWNRTPRTGERNSSITVFSRRHRRLQIIPTVQLGCDVYAMRPRLFYPSYRRYRRMVSHRALLNANASQSRNRRDLLRWINQVIVNEKTSGSTL